MRVPDRPSERPSSPPDEAGESVADVQFRITDALSATHLGEALAAEGVTTIALDEHGTLTEYRPNGTAAPI